MFFGTDDTITAVRINGYIYSIPLASDSDIAAIAEKAKERGLTLTVHKKEVKVKGRLVPKTDCLVCAPSLPSKSVLALEDNFIARESNELFDMLGIVCLVESGPTFFRDLKLIVDGNVIVATSNPGDREVVATVPGRLTGQGTFVCEYGEFQHKEVV